MKKLVLILLLLVLSHSTWAQPYLNEPDLIKPMLERFEKEAADRGIDITDRVSNLDSILVVEQPKSAKGKPSLSGDEADGVTWKRGYTHWIILKKKRMVENEGSKLRLFYHEMGHVMGLRDCCQCRYNIMRCQTGERANYLFRDEDLAKIYLDVFFEAVRDPEKYNKEHIHY